MGLFNQQAVQIGIIDAPESDLSEYLLEAEKLVRYDSVILEKIDADLDFYAKTKKHQRLLDQEWKMRDQIEIPGLSEKSKPLCVEELSLQPGHPRLPALVVYIFLMLRGYLGGFKSKSTQTLLKESQSVRCFLLNCGLKMPGMSTLTENVNAISSGTRSFIFDAQIRMLLKEDLDDFKNLTLDSTAVNSNTTFPTDSVLIRDLIKRIFHRGSHLERFGIKPIQPRNFEYLIKEITSLSLKIAFETSKPKSVKKRKKYYEKLLRLAKKAHEKYLMELEGVDERFKSLNLLPSKQIRLVRVIEWMHEDVASLKQVIDYCEKRILHNQSTPAKEKVMSLIDRDAAYIEKGGREAVIGYKPQLGRSVHGFISSILVPQGNASDSGQLDLVIEDHVERTGVIPEVISTDDGYANKKIRDSWMEKGVHLFSISGSKGKKMIPEEEYSSKEYQDSRNHRSSVESLMFTIKHNFGFGRVMRRGLQPVRDELLEKVLAYNFCRLVEIRKKNKKLNEKTKPYKIAAKKEEVEKKAA